MTYIHTFTLFCKIITCVRNLKIYVFSLKCHILTNFEVFHFLKLRRLTPKKVTVQIIKIQSLADAH